MKGFFALIWREYLGHRGAFLYGPLILIGITVFILVTALFTGHNRVDFGLVTLLSHKFFAVVYFAFAAVWMVYLMGALFFYCADAFDADRRNNAMLFWKSMPVSDFTVLLSKMVAGLTIFPALVFFAFLITGVVAGAVSAFAPMLLPVTVPDTFGTTVAEWSQISVIALCYLVLALVWYLPFFAWVGGLSTLVGRWSIPLALLVPVVFALFEGVIDYGGVPGGSYVISYLRRRLTFGLGLDNDKLMGVLFSDSPLDAGKLLSDLMVAIDWASMLGGVVFALVVIFLASEYRRRTLKG
jgi:ABC-2 type transport system permease protein